MKKVLIILLSLFIISCNNFAGCDNIDKAKLVLINKSTIDETQEVLSAVPLSYICAGDSLLACVVDYKSLVLYNIYSGKLYQSVRIDSVLIRSGFSNATYAKDNCLNRYEDRAYMLSQSDISYIGMPLFEFSKIVPPLLSLDSLTLLVKVLTPYKKDLIYEGKRTDAIWAATSMMLVNFNLHKRSINKITSIDQSLVENNNDKPNASPVYIASDFGSLMYDRHFYTIVGSDLNKFRSISEVGIFNLNDSPSVRFDSYKYPVQYQKYSRNRIMSKEFQVENDNKIWCNSLYSIYTIDAPGQKKEIISFKDLLDSTRQEYINSFYKFDNKRFLIQTVVTDSNKLFFNFRFFDSRTGTISSGKLLKSRRTTSVAVAYNKNNVIFISNDDEHYYIENYKIMEP